MERWWGEARERLLTPYNTRYSPAQENYPAANVSSAKTKKP